MSSDQSHAGYIGSKDDYLRRLRRIEGQARGLQKIVEDALNKIAWTDDAIIARWSGEKLYGDRAEMLVQFRELTV